MPTEPDLVDRLIDYVVRLQPTLAEHRASIERDIRAECGGDRWYVQARPQNERQQRVADVLRLFNGRNATEVARLLHISRATVYRIIKQPGRSQRTWAADQPYPEDAPAQPAAARQAVTPAPQPARKPPRQPASALPQPPHTLSHSLPTAETPPPIA